MKLLILSDIHANYTALRTLWDYEKEADMIVCAGDCVDFGFEPHEVIAWLKEHHVINVIGNHDRYILDRFHEREIIRAKPDSELRTFAEYNIKYMTDGDFEYLRSLPETVQFSCDGYDYLLSHSYNFTDMHFLSSALKNYATLDAFTQIRRKHTSLDKNAPLRIIDGHTHTAMVNHIAQNKFWLNPGSVSYRKGTDHRSKGSDYIAVENGAFRFGHIPYDSAWMVEKLGTLQLEEGHKQVGHSFWDPEDLPD